MYWTCFRTFETAKKKKKQKGLKDLWRPQKKICWSIFFFSIMRYLWNKIPYDFFPLQYSDPKHNAVMSLDIEIFLILDSVSSFLLVLWSIWKKKNHIRRLQATLTTSMVHRSWVIWAILKKKINVHSASSTPTSVTLNAHGMCGILSRAMSGSGR